MSKSISSDIEFEAFITNNSRFISEIRKRLLYTLILFLLASFTGFFFYDSIIKFLIDLLSLKGINIVFTSPFQFINLSITCGLAVGLVTVFPLLLFQILSFLRPALKRKEFQAILRFLPFSLFLFLCGFVFGFFIMKWQIEIFLEKSVSLGIGNILDISRLLSTVLLVSAFMGLAFQFPIIILLLIKLGVLKHRHLAKQRLWVYLGSFLFAILLPADSILADIFLTLPLVLLFEVTLLLIRIFDWKKLIQERKKLLGAVASLKK